MIVIAIIGILAAVAGTQYGQYTKRAKFAEVIAATSPYKTAVSECASNGNTATIAGCADGTGLVPAGFTNRGSIASLVVTDAGVITATGTQEVDNADYVLTPAYTPATSSVIWTVSGSCLPGGGGTVLCKP